MTDKDRIAYLAGCGCDDGPIIEGLANVMNDYWQFLGDAIRERIGEENDSPDEEGTDTDKLKAFRRMIDEAIVADRKARAGT